MEVFGNVCDEVSSSPLLGGDQFLHFCEMEVYADEASAIPGQAEAVAETSSTAGACKPKAIGQSLELKLRIPTAGNLARSSIMDELLRRSSPDLATSQQYRSILFVTHVCLALIFFVHRVLYSV